MDYTLITEAPGLKATSIQHERLLQRYAFVRSFARNGDVLEAGCGSGMGLTYLAEAARSVVGNDIDSNNVAQARRVVGGDSRITVTQGDAHRLAYPDSSFDVVAFLEALYYLEHPETHVAETARVLRVSGHYVLATVNPAVIGFHPSPYTYRYFSAAELTTLLAPHFSSVTLYGGFPVATGMRAQAVTLIKRAAVRWNLIPGSLAARAYLKRLFIGALAPLPTAVTDAMASYRAPERITDTAAAERYTILYAVAQK